MEEFISGTNTANTQAVGDKLYDEHAYKARVDGLLGPGASMRGEVPTPRPDGKLP